MQLTLSQEALRQAVGLVDRITSKNISLPILANILLKAEGKHLFLSATNLEVGITTSVDADISQPGGIAIPARVLGDFLRATKGDLVTLKTIGNTVEIKNNRSKTSILSFDATEYPIIPRILKGSKYSVDTLQLFQLLSGVFDCTATSDSRPELAGVFLVFEPSLFRAAATDSFRLAERKIQTNHTTTGSVIIPRTAVAELLHILPEHQGLITVTVADNQIVFHHPSFELVSRLIDGRYPDYQKIIPERFLGKALVRHTDFEEAVKVSALFSSSIADVLLECTPETLKVSGKNTSKGEAQATIEANLKGDPFTISVNYHYLLDGLKTITTDKVILEFTGTGSPFVLRPENSDEKTTYIIMPLRSA